MKNFLIFILLCFSLLGSSFLKARESGDYQEGDKGDFQGKVISKTEKWIEVRAENGKKMKLMPRWIGGMPSDGGGFEKEMLKKLNKIKVGDRVSLKWLYEEHLRVVEIKKFDPEKSE